MSNYAFFQKGVKSHMEIWEEIYRQIYFIGLQTLRYGKRFFRWFLTLIRKPVKAVVKLIVGLLRLVDKYTLKNLRDDFTEFKMSRKKHNEHSQHKDNSKSGRKSSFSYILNLVMPVISLSVLVFVVAFWSDAAFALEINYDNEVIGYVRDESVYREARNLVLDRLGSGVASTDNSQEENGENWSGNNAEYKIKMVKRTQMSDASEICDKIIEKSDVKITSACGVYIDDKFICAVKNETDALSVFDSILSEHETDEGDAVVSFVENIDYVQGFYPDGENTIKDADFLLNKLKSETEEQYYTIEEGDSLPLIAQKFNMTEEEIKSLNPDLSEDMKKGEKLLLSKASGFLHIQTTKTEYSEAELSYETVTMNTNNLYVGDKKVVSEGENGLEQITSLVTYIDGVEVSTKEVSRKVIKEPISEKILLGTKKKPVVSTPKPQNSKPSGNKKARLGWPTIGAYSISSPYGERDFGDGWHGGVDFVRPGGSSGCTVVSAEAGVVIYTGWYGSGGNTVIIDHGKGLTTMYCHMQDDSIKVSVGQKVTRGQPIGNIGATGFVTGPHLHFEVRVNGKDVNPMPYLY